MQLRVTVDDRKIKDTFQRLPQESARKLHSLIEDSAIDVQREMRIAANVGSTGDLRRSIRYTTNRSRFSAVVAPNVPYAEAVEKGSRPHWTSAKPGSSLAKWARMKGINPYAVQRSIAKKGTRPHPFVEPTYRTMRPRVESYVVTGFLRFVREVNRGLA